MKKLLPTLFLVLVLVTGCSVGDEFKDIRVYTDYTSVQMSESPSDSSKTITKLIVKVKNSGKEPAYLNAKFVFRIVKKINQGEEASKSNMPDALFSDVNAQEFSLLQFANSWTSESGVFQVLNPYTEEKFVVAISLPTGTYIEKLDLVNLDSSTGESIGAIRLAICPYKQGATSSPWAPGKFCQKGELM